MTTQAQLTSEVCAGMTFPWGPQLLKLKEEQLKCWDLGYECSYVGEEKRDY